MIQRAALLAATAAAAVAALASPSRADDYPPPPPPPGYAQPPYAPPPGYAQPMYPAPLAQTTQSTYVPQSVAMSGPEEITNFDASRPVPLGYTPIERTRKHLIVGGAVTLGVTYGVSAFIASVGEDGTRNGGSNDVASLWIPVAGPFLEMGQTDSATARFFLVGMGGAQLAGAIMLYYGLTSTEHVLVRNDLVGSLSVGPMATHGASGMVLSGRF